MRKQLCEALVVCANNPDMIFLTGDLGFMALEPLQAVMGERFINAGVAEQNMISVAAALAKQSFQVWAYSIAPFCYARPFEQIRNDITFHHLPVKLIGNGGGYGYGVMGPTHHAIEDYGILLTLPHMRVYVPVFDEDLAEVVASAAASVDPAYIRIGRGEPPKGYSVPAYSPWRQLTDGAGPVVIAVGPLAGIYIEAFLQMPHVQRPKLWAVTELPLSKNPVPSVLLEQLDHAAGLFIAEEHVAQGGFGSQLVLWITQRGIAIPKLQYLHATQHSFDRYGSQSYLRAQSSLDVASMLAALQQFAASDYD
jgi:transketolase